MVGERERMQQAGCAVALMPCYHAPQTGWCDVLGRFPLGRGVRSDTAPPADRGTSVLERLGSATDQGRWLVNTCCECVTAVRQNGLSRAKRVHSAMRHRPWHPQPPQVTGQRYQNAQTASYQLTLDNDGSPFVWTSNIQIISKVYLTKHLQSIQASRAPMCSIRKI